MVYLDNCHWKIPNRTFIKVEELSLRVYSPLSSIIKPVIDFNSEKNRPWIQKCLVDFWQTELLIPLWRSLMLDQHCWSFYMYLDKKIDTATVMLVTNSWRQRYDGDNIKMLMIEPLCWWLLSLFLRRFQCEQLLPASKKLSLTQTVSNIRRQLWWAT